MTTKDLVRTSVLPLMEDFYTIQGEGAYQGSPAYFIRLGGCDVGCVWCDVKESWDASAHPLVDIEEMASRAAATRTHIAVITGGEPLMYDLTDLTRSIRARNIRTHIETSGAYPMSGEWDWVCFSPKKFKAPHPTVFDHADELKVVIYHKSDIEWATGFVSQLKSSCQLFLQPEWSRHDEVLPLIIDFVKDNPRWQVSLQIHKYMNIP
ncbi:MAG TPA: 7-carboxy-7-deazaguanine synthase QueE [Chryseolinea sp.]|nr:7-carboxy-7-deazaguanine synthase QueE [Chryseolinea sp.]